MERQQQHQQQRRTHRRVTAIFLMLITLSSTIESSYGWTSSSSSNTITSAPASTSASSSKTAAFYKTSSSSILTDDFPSVTFPPPPVSIRKRGRMHNGIYSIQDIHTKISKKQSKSSTKNQQPNQNNDTIIGSKLPWIDYNNKNENENEKYDSNVYLSHWEWQLSYFKQHLTNFRINDDCTSTEAHAQQDKTDYSDLMYTTDNDDDEEQKQQQQQQRIYTVSYKSDEYRDIRITYMNFPGSQFFRCMCYPNSSNVPILGMAYMQFGNGSNTKNMAFMDYQPLPEAHNDKYNSELLRIRSDISSMNTPISHKHFDSEEERKYFTDCPLICKWDNTNDDSEFHHKELVRAQNDYIKTHIKLTKEDMTYNKNNNKNNSNVDNIDTDILKLHSDFDTFVSSKEPAGKLLCNAFGTEIGNQLVHRILFPLSRNNI